MTTNNRPIRIQRSRAKGFKLPPNTKSVTRPGIWGNPFSVEEEAAELIGDFSAARRLELGRELAVQKFAIAMRATDLKTVSLSLDARIKFTIMRDKISELRGKNLACFCNFDGPCHGDILLELANKQ